MREFFKDAQIYLTECTHPDFSYVKYVGLDCKRDPNYLGSSVVLKWIKNRIGRQFFHKTILEEISGTMREVCALEQKYIIELNAVADPDFLNMNGAKPKSDISSDIMSMEFVVMPQSGSASKFITKIAREITSNLAYTTHMHTMLIIRMVSLCVYSYLKYDNEVAPYCRYSHYKMRSPDEVQRVLGALASKDIIDSGHDTLRITDNLIDLIPVDVNHQGFSVTLEE